MKSDNYQAELMCQKKNLYEHFKNTPKKLKIVCDWDEVIQAAYPYAYYLSMIEEAEENKPFGTKYKQLDFATYFNNYWQKGKSNYGIENPSDIYHQMPFLTIAEDLLKLVKEDKVEELIFLSTSDERKIEVFEETFRKVIDKTSLHLLSIEKRWNNKWDWIKDNGHSDFDIFIDDSSNICKGILSEINIKKGAIVCSPYYPIIADQHDKRVLLFEQKVSNLKKEHFSQ